MGPSGTGGDKLSPIMTETQFDNGYWYATELKAFAEAIGVPSASKLRKDEIEAAIKSFLRTGKIKIPTKRSLPFLEGSLTRVSDELADARDGLTRKERVVLWVLSKTQAERGDRNVPLRMLHGRVLEHIDLSIAELQQIVARLGARRP